jgi:general secretion pathway protein K
MTGFPSMNRALTACWTFLTRERSLRRGGAPAPAVASAHRRRRKQRGVAIITVLIAISLTLILTSQFSTSTNIDLIASANYRDQMRAHFLARSALNFTEFVVRLQQILDKPKVKEMIGPVQITEFANQLMLAFCGSAQEVRAAVGDAATLSKGLGADIGTCGVVGTISTDDDKINMNCVNETSAARTGASYADVTKSSLDALLLFNAYDPVFEEADAENWRRDRNLQVAALIDYVDSNNIRGVNERGTTEDYGYENLKDHYKPKNASIDTVGELKLVRGVDDRFWTLFGSAFTVYGGCKINLSAVSNVQLIAAILALTAQNKSDPVVLDPQKLFALAGIVAKAKQFGMQFNSTKDFVEFVKAPAAKVGALTGKAGVEGDTARQGADMLNQLMGGQTLGLELIQADVDALATAEARRTYRVQAWGEIERSSTSFPPIRSTITGVWDTKVFLTNIRKTATDSPTAKTPRGAWVFLRED